MSLHVTTSASGSSGNIKKLASSPKIHRQLSYKAPNDSSSSNINPSLITNLQFSGSSNSSSSSGYQSSPVISLPNTLTSSLTFKQIYMSPLACKSYDNIINIINQQVNFCSLYLTGSSGSSSVMDLSNSPSTLTNSYSNFNTINRFKLFELN